MEIGAKYLSVPLRQDPHDPPCDLEDQLSSESGSDDGEEVEEDGDSGKQFPSDWSGSEIPVCEKLRGAPQKGLPERSYAQNLPRK